MHITWDDPAARPFKPGDLYIGIDPKTGREVGVTPDTAALTVAKARTGKGAGVMIPNLLRWNNSALVIDPKGEAAEATAEKREWLFGMPSYVLDPFEYCDIPDRLRARFNPLDEIDVTARGAREDILTLADGIIMRHDPRSEHWEGGGAGYLAGLIAFTAAKAPPERRHLKEVADLVNTRGEELRDLWESMAECSAAGNLARDAGRRMLTSGREAQHFDSVVKANTGWLSSEDIAPLLIDSTFRLSDLRTKGCTVYLVLPPDMIDAHPHFLRLFVMAAIRAMARHKDGRRCLFLLDEFYALGHIAKTDKAAGLLPGFGCHLWPFLQNIGQLVELYGVNASEAFIENADVLQFFGLGPGKTAEYVSGKLGTVDLSEVDAPPATMTGMDMGLAAANWLSQRRMPRFKSGSNTTPPKRAAAFGVMHSMVGGMIGAGLHAAEYMNQRTKAQEMQDYQHQARLHRSPRVTPGDVVEMVGKDNTALARGQITFIRGNKYLLGLRPWFNDKTTAAVTSKSSLSDPTAAAILRQSLLGE